MYRHAPLEQRLFLRGRIWAFQGYDYRGKRYKATTHQTDRKAAIKAARKIEDERAVLPSNPASHRAQTATLDDGLTELELHDVRVNAPETTRQFHEDCGGHLCRFFKGEALLVEIANVATLKKYTDKRLAEE